jgi:hypothetical protein
MLLLGIEISRIYFMVKWGNWKRRIDSYDWSLSDFFFVTQVPVFIAIYGADLEDTLEFRGKFIKFKSNLF